jgi:20S proteasome alpha/beta subunit
MTLIIGARCLDGAIVASDRRRLARYEKGPDTKKLHKLSCSVMMAGAGDEGVLNEARFVVERRIGEVQQESTDLTLLDVVEITSTVVNELASYYRDMVEEPFGFALTGLENLNTGDARLYTIFGGGFLEVPWACFGAGAPYARPLVDLLLAKRNLTMEEAAKVIPAIFTLVSNVQMAVGGGVDICCIRDKQGTLDVVHVPEIDLTPLKQLILESINIKEK